MAFYRGQDGFMSLGGYLVGSPDSVGVVTAGSSTFSIDAATLLGAVIQGDTFTVAGETGSPVHTVQTGPNGPLYVATANAIGPITFSPVAAAGGWADEAAVTFAANSISQVVSWSLQTTEDLLDADVMGVSWHQFVGGLGGWTGSMQVRLDLTDARQAALVNGLLTSNPLGQPVGLTFGVKSDGATFVKQFIGAAIIRDIQIQNQLNQLASMTCNFTGTGNPLPNWQP